MSENTTPATPRPNESDEPNKPTETDWDGAFQQMTDDNYQLTRDAKRVQRENLTELKLRELLRNASPDAAPVVETAHELLLLLDQLEAQAMLKDPKELHTSKALLLDAALRKQIKIIRSC